MSVIFGPTQVKCRILSYRIFLRSHSQRFGKKGKMSDKKILLEIYPNIFFLLRDRTEIIQIISVRYKPVKDWQRKISFQIQQINSSDKKFSLKKRILLFPQIKILWRVWPNIAHNCNKIAANSISHFRNFLAEFFSELNFLKERFFFILIL